MNGVAALAVATALAMASAPASAAIDPAAGDPAGNWVGTLHTRTIDIAVGLEIRRTASGYEGVYDALSQGYWAVPLTPARRDTPLELQVTNLSGTLAFAWDPASRRWTGQWREKGLVYPMTLKRGVIPPAPLVSRQDKIIFPILGAVLIVETIGIVWLLRLRRRRVRLRRA